MILKELIKSVSSKLNEQFSANESRNILFLIFQHIFGFSKIDLIIKEDETISIDNLTRIDNILMELKTNKPIQQILGETEFYDLKFTVNKNVLIPRPETEELVDWIIKDNKTGKVNILDIGTGSGCIAISLAKNIPAANISAIDISSNAIELAKQNATLNSVKVEFLVDDIFSTKIEQTYDIIVSNPPYIRELEKSLMQNNVLDFEPHNALFVNNDNPFVFYIAIINLALKQNISTIIYFEINEYLHSELKVVLEQMSIKNFEFRKDINGKYRMLKIKL